MPRGILFYFFLLKCIFFSHFYLLIGRLSQETLAEIPGISSPTCRKMALVCGPILFNLEAERSVEFFFGGGGGEMLLNIETKKF